MFNDVDEFVEGNTVVSGYLQCNADAAASALHVRIVINNVKRSSARARNDDKEQRGLSSDGQSDTIYERLNSWIKNAVKL